MTIDEQIDAYLAAQPEAKRGDMRALHAMILKAAPECRLWYLDGRNDAGKVVSNPNIGYGERTIDYADGTSREFYRIGMSANTSGISIYVIGLDDRKRLTACYGERIGKASITGYCIKFRKLADVNLDTIEEIIRMGFML